MSKQILLTATGGDVVGRLTEGDWDPSGLGAPATWSLSFRQQVEVLLNGAFPMFIVWGPERRLIYNDAYRSILGDKHPHALGRPFFDVWPEVRDQIEPVIEAAFGGQASFFEDLEVRLVRGDRVAPAWFTFAYSPIPIEGAIPGVLCVCVETTSAAMERAAREESERTLLFLDRLTTATSNLASADAVMSRTTALVGAHMGVSVCAYADMDEDEDGFTIRGDWAAPGSTSIVGHYRLADFGRMAVDNLTRGQPLVINDNRVEIAAHEAATFQAIGIGSTICMPLVRNGRLRALMAVHHKGPHQWTDQELALLREATERSWAFVERVGAECALLESEARSRLATEFGDIGLWDVNEVEDALYWDDTVRAMFGVAPGTPVNMADFYTGLHPDDLAATSTAYAAAADPLRRGVYDVEYRTVSPGDGGVRWVAAKGRGVFDEHGRCLRVVGTAIDITARKHAEEARDLLMREVDHRARNSLAVIQSVVRLTEASDPAAFRQAVHSRIEAMSRAQASLAKSNWRGSLVGEVVRDELLSSVSESSRVRLSGSAIPIIADYVQPLGMILHELVTNAIKYGSFSSRDGIVDIRWSGTAKAWSLHWKEQGGPLTVAPSRTGFGSRLMTSLARQLNGAIKFQWEPDGLAVDLEVTAEDAAN